MVNTRPQDVVTCPRCRVHLRLDLDPTDMIVCQVTLMGNFDVAAAIALVRKLRRPAKRFRPSTLQKLFNSRVHRPHLAHVNTRVPGIRGRMTVNGVKHVFLIEGNHRTARAIEADRPFRLYDLTEEETRLVFMGRRASRGKRWVA
jgi:hypothetical protein